MPDFFATCPRGIEVPLAEELRLAGASAVETVSGGASFAGDWAVAYRANLNSRVATRIVWRVGAAAYRREEDIYRFTRSLPWPEWFDVTRTIRVYVTAIRSPLKSLDFITLRIKDAVCDRFRSDRGSRPSVDTTAPQVRIHAFLTATEAVLYLDTSGDPLYKRGFKRAAVEAPLKENLAAGILRLTHWASDEPLLDPMCGSGTFLIEAAQIALEISPGLGRTFGFEQIKIFDRPLWESIREEAESRRRAVVPLMIFGSDLYGDQLRRARENLDVAGLGRAVQLKQANILELPSPAERGVMVANPPYGVRMSGSLAPDEFYRQLGDALKQRFAGWRCYLFSADTLLPKAIGLRAKRKTPLYNGALECRLYEYDVIAGTMRRSTTARADGGV
jgi:putative N6-adenine-specific DNA methylase